MTKPKENKTIVVDNKERVGYYKGVNMVRRLKLSVLISSMCIITIGLLLKNFNLIFISILLILLNNIIFSVERIGDRVIFLFFNISFFTFLLGNYISNLFNLRPWIFPAKVITNTLIMLYISLLSVFFGFIISMKSTSTIKLGVVSKFINKLINIIRKIKFIRYMKSNTIVKIIQKINNPKEHLIDLIRIVSKILYYFTYSFILINTIEIAVYVHTHGYLSLYTTFSPKFPHIFIIIGQMNTIFLYLFLSTFPSRKKLSIPLILFLIYLSLSILTGQRGTFVKGIFVIISYLIMRQSINNTDKETFINYKLIIIIAPFLVVFLGAYNIIRKGTGISNFNFINLFFQFFKDQGSSSNIISYVQIFKDKLFLTNYNYTFSPIINLFLHGPIGKLISGTPYIKGNTIESAMYGNNLGATITYLINKKLFLSGGGYGTQYIAEVYADYGYFGVIIYNILIGVLISKIIKVFNKKSWLGVTFSLLICNDIFFMPRDFALNWIMNFFAIKNWIAILLTYIISCFLYQKKHNKC